VSLQPAVIRALAERALDEKVAFLGRIVSQPIGPVGAAAALIRETESQDVAAVIDALLTI